MNVHDPLAALTVTIITTTSPARVCKAYSSRPDGGLDKSAVANLTEGIAQSYIVQDADEKARLLEGVTSSDNKVIVPARWHADDRSPFFIYSKAKLAALLGVAEDDVPVGIVEHEGRRVAARLKAGMVPSSWVLCDADNPPGIPPEWAAKDIQQRLEMFEPLLPGISQVTRVELCGSSARVVRNGEPGKGATHAWIRVSDPSKIALMKAHVGVEMVNRGLSFPYEKHSRTTGDVVGIEHRSVFDLTVFDTGRIVFCAKPDVSRAHGYRCNDADIAIVDGIDVLDLSFLKLPEPTALREYKQKTGIKLNLKVGTNGSLSTISRGLLALNTEIERRGEVRPLCEWLDIMAQQGIDHLRCEAPFRASSSEAAFIRRTGTECGFVHDVGNGTTYLLDETAIRAANIANLTAHFRENPLPVTTPLFGVTNAAVAAIPDTAVSERLAYDFHPLNLGPHVLPDHDLTRTGHPAQKQITTMPRVSFVMRALELKPSMNVYARQPIIASNRSPWYDPANDDSAAIMGALGHACARCGMSSRALIEDTAVEAAGQNMFNPVLDWVRSAPWDGRSRFSDFTATLEMSDQTQNRWRDIALRRCCIQAVTAWQNFNRGSAAKSVPYVPVLNGKQGIFKTKWVAALLPEGWVKTDMSLRLDHNERDAVTRVTANPIVELAEVDASFRKSDVASLKTFLSSNVDSHRPPYGRRLLSTPRSTVYVATVNPSGFLVDATGARRFWPLQVERCHFDHGIDLQQYWAEVFTWVESGEQYWLSDDESVLHNRIVAEHAAETPVSELVVELTVAREGWPEKNGIDTRQWVWEGTRDLFQHAGIGHDPARMGEFNERMRGAGFERRTNDRKWRVPDLPAWRSRPRSARTAMVATVLPQ
jgi:hypothetical protein